MAKNKIVAKNKKPKSNKATGRNYDYDKRYQASKDQIANRVKRNQARRSAIKNGSAKVGDGKDVDHIKPLSKGGSNRPSNTRVISKRVNRARK